MEDPDTIANEWEGDGWGLQDKGEGGGGGEAAARAPRALVPPLVVLWFT